MPYNTWSAYLYEQNATRAVYKPLVGSTPRPIPLVTNANKPQLYDLTLQPSFQPALVKGQTPPVIGLVDFVPQQIYRDVPPIVWKPTPNTQGPVPPLVEWPQQTYVDVPPIVWKPAPNVQGPVPPLVYAPPQPDTSQLGTWIFRPSVAPPVVTGPVPPLIWASPAWDLTQKALFVAPMVAPPLATGPVPPIVWAAPQWDLTQKGTFSAPLVGSTPQLIPLLQAQPQDPRSGYGQIFQPSIAAPIVTGPVPQMIWATPRQEHQIYLGSFVWMAAATPIINVATVPHEINLGLSLFRLGGRVF